MILVNHVVAVLSDARKRVVQYLLSHRIRARNPTLICHPTAVFDYPWSRPDAIEIGRDVAIMAHCEIVVLPEARHSSKEGRLILADGAAIGAGANIRAAGGVIRLGRGSGIAQNTVAVAINHQAVRGAPYRGVAWDESRSGVTLGDNVWVGANCTLLPGITIGDNSLVAAGSVVTKDIPPNQIWGGVPARYIKDVPERADTR